MSLLRRRFMILRKSSGNDNPWGDLPAESTTFAFPLYINIIKQRPEYTEEWYRDGDDLLEQFYDWIFENATIDHIDSNEVPPELLASNKIYINGGLVEEAIERYGTIELYGEAIPFDEVYMDTDGLEIFAYGAKLPQGGGESELIFPITLVEGDNGAIGKRFYKYVKDGRYTNEEVYVINNGYILQMYYWGEMTGNYVCSFDWEVVDASNGSGSPGIGGADLDENGFLTLYK